MGAAETPNFAANADRSDSASRLLELPAASSKVTWTWKE
jgi:hypothetical protein